MDETQMRQSMLGELRRIATVSQPDICARLAGLAPRINSRRGSDAYRINGLARAAREWRLATVLDFASPSRPRRTLVGTGGEAAPAERAGPSPSVVTEWVPFLLASALAAKSAPTLELGRRSRTCASELGSNECNCDSFGPKTALGFERRRKPGTDSRKQASNCA